MANGDFNLFNLGTPSGAGLEFLKQFLQKRELKTQEDTLQEAPKETTTPTPVEPTVASPTEPSDAGVGFLSDQLTPQVTPQESEPLKVQDVQKILAEQGFNPSIQNVERYLINNLETESNIQDFSGLDSSDPKEVVPSVREVVGNALKYSPFGMVMSQSKPVFHTVIEGLERWEAAKATFVRDFMRGQFPTETASALLTGQVKTPFPEAKLRGSEQFEFGDIFRELGLPEGASATLGLTAEIASDIPIFGGIAKGITDLVSIGKGAKRTKVADDIVKEMVDKFGVASFDDLAAEGMTEVQAKKLLVDGNFSAFLEGLGTITNTKVLNTVNNQWLAAKSTQFGKDILAALKGESIFHPLGPAMKTTIRQSVGDAGAQSFDAGTLAQEMHRFATVESVGKMGFKKKVINNEKLVKLHEALTDGPKSASYQSLSKAEQTTLDEARQLIDRNSAALREELLILQEADPKKFEALAKRVGIKEAGKIPLDKLIKIIEENQGSYVKRSYELYMNKKYVPNSTTRQAAIKGLVKDGLVKNPMEANKVLDDILETKKINLFSPKSKAETLFTVDEGSFISRQRIPQYLRDFMGEIKDPRVNTIQTIKSLSEARINMRIIRELKTNALISNVETKALNHQIKTSKAPLAYTGLDGMFTSPEIAAALQHVTKYSDTTDKFIISAMKNLKAAKTIFNPKTHSHNFQGNVFFSLLAGVDPVTNSRRYTDVVKMWRNIHKVNSGKLPKSHPDFQTWRELVKNNVVGTELPSSDKITILEELLDDPYSAKKFSKVPTSFQNMAKKVAEMYAFEDQLFKAASYLEYTKGRGMGATEAVDEVYRWFPNYFEAAKIAETARNTTGGLMFLNPFTTFRAEAHRILLNGFKDPSKRLMTSMILGSRVAWNSAMLSLAGNSMSDVGAYFQSRPEAVSELLLIHPELDINTKYLDPFNTEGLFAPLMMMAGAQGVNPFDYLLDFTTLSSDFGYSNLLVGALESPVTGIGRYGQELSPTDRVMGLAKGLGPTSFTSDLPKILDPNEAEMERFRRILRFVGIDVEARNPKYIRRAVSKHLRDKIDQGEDPTPTINALTAMGFDGEKMLSNAQKTVKRKEKGKKKSKRQDTFDAAINFLGL